MVRFLFSSLLVLPVSFSLLYADEKLEHAPAYEVGDVIHTEIEMNADLITTIFGKKIKSSGNNFVLIEQKVTAASADQVALDSRISRIKQEIEFSDDVRFSADSRNPVAELPASDAFSEEIEFFKLLSQLKWTTTLNANRQLEEVKYHDEFLHKIPTQFDDFVSPELVILEANNAIARLPGKNVAVGEKWIRKEERPFGAGLVFHFEREFEYLGSEKHHGKQMAKIGFKAKSVKYDAFDAVSLVQVKSGKLKSNGSKGTLWYDIAAKQVVESKESLHIVGTLVVAANGQELPREIDLTFKMSSKVSRE